MLKIKLFLLIFLCSPMACNAMHYPELTRNELEIVQTFQELEDLEKKAEQAKRESDAADWRERLRGTEDHDSWRIRWLASRSSHDAAMEAVKKREQLRELLKLEPQISQRSDIQKLAKRARLMVTIKVAEERSTKRAREAVEAAEERLTVRMQEMEARFMQMLQNHARVETAPQKTGSEEAMEITDVEGEEETDE